MKAADEKRSATNLVALANSGLKWRLLYAAISGLLLALAYPPCGQSWLVWIAFCPLLVFPTPRRLWERLLTGYLFGYIASACSLLWLNEVGFGAGFLLAIWCALFPMAWYFLLSTWNWHWKAKKDALQAGGGLLFMPNHWLMAGTVLFSACSWTALEWIRGWLFTGFPWNHLGVVFYRMPSFLSLASYTGGLGIGFCVMLVSGAISAEIARFLQHQVTSLKVRFPVHLFLGILGFLALILPCFCKKVQADPKAPILRVAVIQGNIPQCRVYTPELYDLALNTYDSETRRAARLDPSIQLFVWPECAVPEVLEEQRYAVMRLKLLQDIRKPLLVGALQYRRGSGYNEIFLFNSAFLLNETGQIRHHYDKTHRVPFGEFTPFGDYFPWLRRMIGMGRDLTPGRALTLLPLPSGGRAGINICFEDAFPEISREFTKLGANLLVTMANDSWYNRSAGAEQHMAQMVLRAVENRRPFLRSGNNSHSCLVTPYGQILGLMPFTRDFQIYEIPIQYWGTTFYTRHGDWFAILCFLGMLAGAGWLLYARLREHNRNMAALQERSR